MQDEALAGYRPLQLTLTGFKGIRSGLGRDQLRLDLEAIGADATLVAIGGANGRGKTTVMDNLHPYLVMPSRAGADGLGAFSYYDQVYLPESQKELVWSHLGRMFKSQLVFRINGKRKTEAYLFEQVGGQWTPARAADGTPSDGKVDTYKCAVTEVLGPAPTFFSSVFSAQGKRPMSAYKNGEIKSLLADLLGLEEVREQGAKAADTAKLLKAGLSVIRLEQAQADQSCIRLERERQTLGDPEAALIIARADRAMAIFALDQVREKLSAAKEHQVAAGAVERRRAELIGERARQEQESLGALRKQEAESARLAQRISALEQRILDRRRQQADRRRQMLYRRAAIDSVMADAGRIEQALRRQALAARVVEARKELLTAAKDKAALTERVEVQLRSQRQTIGAIEREAGQLALRQADLERRFGMTGAVPCAGMAMQDSCPLLGDAHSAKALLPSVDSQMDALAQRKSAALASVRDSEASLKACGDSGERLARVTRRFEVATKRWLGLQQRAARKGELAQATTAQQAIDAELEVLLEHAVPETTEEAADQADILAAQGRAVAERASVKATLTKALEGIDAALDELPKPFDAKAVLDAKAEYDADDQLLQATQARETLAVRRSEQAAALVRQLGAASRAKREADDRAARIETELGAWVLLAKCLSNDGVIALSIDDAGPTLAALANDLLLTCYGARFTVELVTQSATAKGELREDFDITVHDGLRDESKSLKLVSGGERVWINECLTRAIALYLAGSTGRQFGTLFSDEADGPLDPEHKRMFMEMKREVLRLGGYQREFFVSQTPELNAMADALIDLDAMVVPTLEET